MWERTEIDRDIDRFPEDEFQGGLGLLVSYLSEGFEGHAGSICGAKGHHLDG